MSLDIGQLAKDMFAAAFPILKEKAPGIRTYAEGEFKKIAQTLQTIQEQFAEGDINEVQARLLLDMQKSASRSVLLTCAGLSLLTAENALNAALNVVKTAVNSAIGIAII